MEQSLMYSRRVSVCVVGQVGRLGQFGVLAVL